MPNLNTREGVMSLPDIKDSYDSAYPAYRPDELAVGQLKTLIKNKKITIVLGTWCGDSKLQVPHFYKVIDQAGVEEQQVTLICVDESKQAEDGQIDGLNIDRIPVFIITENDQEIGRITESPRSTLENDMVEILKKQN
jgi:thiol-disulfide isomerase/thioredoxin